MLDRFNVRVIVQDHSRSMTKYPTEKPDRLAKSILLLVPLVAGAATVYFEYRIASPSALVPATSLLAGIFFGAVGQLISIRARIADSVALAGNKRLRAHIRESVSGLLLAALTALFVSLLLGGLILLPQPATDPKIADRSDGVLYWSGVIGSALIFAFLSYMVLLFVSSARRLYASYLEAFEGGLPLPRRSHLSSAQSDDVDDEDDDLTPTADAGSLADRGTQHG